MLMKVEGQFKMKISVKGETKDQKHSHHYESALFGNLERMVKLSEASSLPT